MWNNVLCNCTVVTKVIVIRNMMYCDVTSGLCTYIVYVFSPFESWQVCNVKYKYYTTGTCSSSAKKIGVGTFMNVVHKTLNYLCATNATLTINSQSN